MARASARQGRALLLTLMARLGQIRVKDAYLPKEGSSVIHGYTYSDGSIAVNTVPAIVDTLVHELLHSCFPKYSESTVRRLTSHLMHAMTDAELLAFYDAFRQQTE